MALASGLVASEEVYAKGAVIDMGVWSSSADKAATQMTLTTRDETVGTDERTQRGAWLKPVRTPLRGCVPPILIILLPANCSANAD
jgi:hypothetical protein